MEELKGIEQLVSHMLGIRESRLAEWRELSRWIAGNRGIFEKRLNDKWDDLTLFRGVATQALQRGASGMTSSMTPRNISWFRAEFRDRQLEELSGAREWLDEIGRRIGDCLSEGGFYQAIHLFNTDLIWAGCALLYAETSGLAPLRYECCQIGTFCVALDFEGQLECVARNVLMTHAQAAREFGEAALSRPARERLKKEPYADLAVWHVVRRQDSGRWPVASWWYEEGGETFLRRSGYEEMPFFFTCWNKGVTPYGTGPGDAALPDARQLDALERAKLDGLDKLLTPPMWANAGVKEELDLSSGAINYTGPGSEVKPILDLSPYVQALPGIMQEIATVSARLDQTLLASIFSSLPLDQRPRDMSATEFLERKREVLQQVGPVISAYEPEVLTPLLWRTARSLERMGLSQPAPDSLRDIPLYLQMRFISPMANALRATDAEAVRALLTDTLQICQANPEVLDKVDLDQCIDELASGLGAPGSVIRADSDVAALRQQRMEQMQAMQEQQRQQEQTNA